MFDSWIQFLTARAKRRFSVKDRTIAVALGAAAFVVLFPVLVLWAGTLRGWRAALLPDQNIAMLLAILLFFYGAIWMGWSVYWQLAKSGGTPVPVMPPLEFLATGPYRYTRNPMMLGFWSYLFGWVFLSNTTGSLLAVLIIIVFFWAELKWIEEKELELRFGEAYREYKKRTPFLLPRFKK